MGVAAGMRDAPEASYSRYTSVCPNRSSSSGISADAALPYFSLTSTFFLVVSLAFLDLKSR